MLKLIVGWMSLFSDVIILLRSSLFTMSSLWEYEPFGPSLYTSDDTFFNYSVLFKSIIFCSNPETLGELNKA